MDFSVKTTAAKNFDDVLKNFPEMAAAAASGVRFAPAPAPSIDLGKLRAGSCAQLSARKLGRKM